MCQGLGSFKSVLNRLKNTNQPPEDEIASYFVKSVQIGMVNGVDVTSKRPFDERKVLTKVIICLNENELQIEC